MSVTYVLQCDRCRFTLDGQASTVSVAQARKSARAGGWKCDGRRNKDYCEECSNPDYVPPPRRSMEEILDDLRKANNEAVK